MSDSTGPSFVPPEPSPESASVPPTPAQSAASPAAEGTGLPPNIAAGLASLLSIVGGVVFLVLEKKNPFVRFYAMQALILGGGSIALSLALQIVIAILHLIPFVGQLLSLLLGFVGMIVGLAFFVAWVVTVIKSFSGQEWEVPYIGKIAREQLAKGTPSAS